MVKIINEQSENDRLRALNAELLEACKAFVNPVGTFADAYQKAVAAIAKAANQEAGEI